MVANIIWKLCDETSMLNLALNFIIISKSMNDSLRGCEIQRPRVLFTALSAAISSNARKFEIHR